ncbi:hypothetical protein [Antribacter soli]|uniref:hypothetical protein n=1 Tax=Antribacter soli TaxID=2910976 RepID=UPI003556FD02
MAVASGSATAYVALQEANAVAVVDLASATVTGREPARCQGLLRRGHRPVRQGRGRRDP